MANENLDTTNKLIKPEDISPSDDEVIRQLSNNLQGITPEDVDAMCDEMDEAKKMEEENGGGLISEIDESKFEFERSKMIVKRKGKTFDLNSKSGEKDFMNEVFWVSDITKILPILGEIFGDSTMYKLHEYLTGGGDESFMIT